MKVSPALQCWVREKESVRRGANDRMVHLVQGSTCQIVLAQHSKKRLVFECRGAIDRPWPGRVALKNADPTTKVVGYFHESLRDASSQHTIQPLPLARVHRGFPESRLPTSLTRSSMVEMFLLASSDTSPLKPSVFWSSKFGQISKVR